MEYYTLQVLYLFPIILIIHILSKFLNKSKPPPGPKPWPIIGNIHQLGDKPHHTLTKLSKTYGPIMSLKLGSVTTIVVSSPEIAKEMFLKHDLNFSNRAIPDTGRVGGHDKFSMVWLPVNPKWRNLRKIANIQLFARQRLDGTQFLRQKKVKELIEYVQKCCDTSVPVDIGKAAFITSLNLLSNTIFSMDLASYTSLEGQEFKDIVCYLLEEGAKPNVSDYFPLLRDLDLQGALKRCNGYFYKMLGIIEGIIDERLKNNAKDNYDDVLGTLLKLVKDEELSLTDVKHFLFDLFIAGTETTSVTLEWAMANLLRNPSILTKTQNEVSLVIGKDETIQESHISNLPYIQAIIKETFRLHPPVPLLLHKGEKSVELGGYFVPKSAHTLVNVWSIGRDSSVWSDPLLFSPERFLENEIDVKGQHFELIPFGAGRRMCPGIPLAYRMVQLMLASITHSFNWKYIEDGRYSTEVDLEERFGLTLQKAKPLLAIPFPRWLSPSYDHN